MTEFIALGGSHLQAQFSEIIGSVIHCISDSEPDIAAAAKNANAGNDTYCVVAVYVGSEWRCGYCGLGADVTVMESLVVT
jgi:cellulase/cellobiase CelA1